MCGWWQFSTALLTTVASCLFSSLGDVSSFFFFFFLDLRKISLFKKILIPAMHASINFYVFKSFFFGTEG